MKKLFLSILAIFTIFFCFADNQNIETPDEEMEIVTEETISKKWLSGTWTCITYDIFEGSENPLLQFDPNVPKEAFITKENNPKKTTLSLSFFKQNVFPFNFEVTRNDVEVKSVVTIKTNATHTKIVVEIIQTYEYNNEITTLTTKDVYTKKK